MKDSVDAFELLLSGGVGGIPFVAFAGSDAARYGTWQRLSYGSKDVKELAVFMDRVNARITKQGRLGSSAPAPGRRTAPRTGTDAVWESVCTAKGYDALDGLDPKAFAAARRTFLADPRHETLRLTGTKHPDSTAHRAEQLERAPGRGAGRRSGPGPDRARRTSSGTRSSRRGSEYEETIADLLGPCSEVLLDFEGRQISPDWLDVPEKVVLALLRHGIVPGEDRHLLFRVPNPFIEPDEEKISKILAVGRPRQRPLPPRLREARDRPGAERASPSSTVPQVNSDAEIGAVVKIGTLYLPGDRGALRGVGRARRRVPPRAGPRGAPRRAARRASRRSGSSRSARTSARSPTSPTSSRRFYLALERGRGVADLPTPDVFRTRFDGSEADRPRLRRDVGHRRAERQDRDRRRLHAGRRRARGGRAPPGRARAADRRAGPDGHVPHRRRARGLPWRIRPRAPGRHHASSRAPTA